ncbi:MAG: RNA polymerase sporulation sigma factor SigH [Mycobacteriales bacterium]
MQQRPGAVDESLLDRPTVWPPDGELVRRLRAGDEAALVELLDRYRGFARGRARSYFLVGADREDLMQEAMIGLYKAVRDFNEEIGAPFRAFAEVCITRQILTAIKAATRQKHGPLNSYVSISSAAPDGEGTVADALPTGASSDPAELVISAERIQALQRHFDEALSDLEIEVLRLYVDGKTYQEIAVMLDRQVKSVDNALQRIKRKLDGHLRTQEDASAG